MAPETPKKSMWADLPRRVATICIGFPFVWTTLSFSATALVFFICVHGLATWEYSLLEPKQEKPSTPQDLSASSRLMFCAVSLLLAHITGDSLFHLVLCCVVGIFTWIERWHWILGLIVITIPFRTWYILSADFASTISILLVVWNCDTGALIFGRLSSKFGIRRLPVPDWIRNISPAKSMEGFIGGVVGGSWTAVSWIPRLVSWFHMDTTPKFDILWGTPSYRLTLGVSMSLMAIFGDLIESSIKRQSQAKDSGSVLPGHGGILDRFDSSLLAVLLYSFFLEYLNTTER